MMSVLQGPGQQLPPGHKRNVDDLERTTPEPETWGVESALGRALASRSRDDAAIFERLRRVPASFRETARIVAIRQLGGTRGNALADRAFDGGGQLRLPPVEQVAAGNPVLAERWELARAQGLRDVVLGLLDRGGVGEVQALARAVLAGAEPHRSAAARRLLERPLRDRPASSGFSSGRPRERAPAPPDPSLAPPAGHLLAAADRRAATLLRRAEPALDEADPGHPAVQEALGRAGAGAPLPEPLRREMSARFHADFGAVRIHVDSVADRAARAVGARAFTVGEDIFFAAGAFDESRAGRELLAHELTHVLQAYQGRVPTGRAATVSRVGDPLEIEADNTARVVLSDDPKPVVDPRAASPARLPATSLHPKAGRLLRSPDPARADEGGPSVESRLNAAAAQVEVRVDGTLVASVSSKDGAAAQVSVEARWFADRKELHLEIRPAALRTRTSPAGLAALAGRSLRVTVGGAAPAAAPGGAAATSGHQARNQVLPPVTLPAQPADSRDAERDDAAPAPSGPSGQSPPAAQSAPSAQPSPPGPSGSAAQSIPASRSEASPHPESPPSDASPSGNSQGHGDAHGSPGSAPTGGPGHRAPATSAGPATSGGDAPTTAPGPTAAPTPISPELAAATQRIQQAAASDKAALEQSIATLRTQLLSQSEAKAKERLERARAQAQQLGATIDGRRAAALASIAGARSALAGRIAAAKGKARAEETRALAALAAKIAEKERAALTAAAHQADLALEFGRTEASRGRKSALDVAGRIEAMASSKSSSFTAGSDKAQNAGRDAIRKGAAEAIAKVKQNGEDLAKDAVESAARLSQGLRDAGRKLADSIGKGREQPEKAIRDATAATLRRIDGVARDEEKQLATLEQQAGTSFDHARTDATMKLETAGHDAAESIRKAGRTQAEGLGRSGSDQAQALDDAARRAVAELVGKATGKNLDPKDIEAFTGAVVQQLGKARADVERDLAQGAGKVGGTLDQACIAADASLSKVAAEIDRKVGERVTAIDSGGREAEQHATRQLDGATRDQKQGNDQAIGKFTEGMQEQITRAEAGWKEQRTGFEKEVRGKVDKGIDGQLQIERQLPAKLDAAARKAAEQAEGSILSGIWSAIKSFLPGLLLFVGLVLIVFGVILLAVAFGWVALGIGAALALAITIVSIGFLVYGFVTSFIRRWNDFMATGGKDAPWWKKALMVLWVGVVAVGDVFGVSPLLEGLLGVDFITGERLTKQERARRITEGLLTIAMMFLLRGLVKGLKGPGSGKVDPNVDPRVDPNDPRIDPGEKPVPKPGEVPPPGLSPKLLAIRNGLTDPRAIEAFDAKFESLGRDSAKMEKILEGMDKGLKEGKTLQDRLIDEWNKNHPTPPSDAVVKQIDAKIDRANQLKAEVDAYDKAHPEVKGTREWIKRLDGELKGLNQMRGNANEATSQKLRGADNNLDGIESELRAAQERSGVDRVNADKVFKTSAGDKVDVDVVADNGRTWVESKSTEPYDTSSRNWAELRVQVEKLLDAARANPVDGQPPRLVIRFSKGVGERVATELRNMKVTVEGEIVKGPPKGPLPPVGPQPDHDDDPGAGR